MECRRRPICLEKVSAVTNRRDLLHLSYSDIRRIAAARASVRLYERIQRQEKAIPLGQLALNSTSANSLLPAVTNRHLVVINATWAVLIKGIDYHGVRIIARCLAKKPELIHVFPKLAVCKRCRLCPSLKENPAAIQYGRSLLMHITDIITNLRNNAALENYVRQKFRLLRAAGLEKEDIEMFQDVLVEYLAETEASGWSVETGSAWKLMSAAIISLGTDDWNPAIPSLKKTESSSTLASLSDRHR
ncbi:hypothetical protein BsWGS_13467 [Bradybaena similaris]